MTLASLAASAFVAGAIIVDTSDAFADEQPASTAGWGGYRNGEIPTSALKQVGPIFLRADAADALVAMMAAYKAARGKDLILNDGYRSLAGQWQAYRDMQAGGNLAAYPGTSNHGWAVAIDLGGSIYTGNNADHRWLQDNAGRFGWWWEGRTFRQIEYHHWTFNGAYVAPEPEDDMFSDQDRALLQSIRDAMKLEARSWYKIIHTANDNNIWVVGVTGKRVRVQQTYHVELLRRFRDEDTLNTAELDLLRTNYLEPIA